ncbi:hypothetical protein OQJ19_14625 [Fluoribacter gormanii]|uniref:Uncharacterized protein n=1 Tax=Fluoribacter gormanii TaxID=464 RepID=A0A377GJM9_9GAMM|nr:hypothetical protein [Fluoribacter gormanii]KTD00908.1 hypothetical protein Lgor_2825 [Fluoribacter gormanii]MCW8443436.1 hypothetical protein [Fluoribacter gormanii]MCW8471864.1 hypothetical protein [Fluoribacter gormanii]SIQ81356.1 hypothetical protein SAMN05421777_103136 [Fluoribacter gormanii]STO25026.1 Uncharacterised protein [Fluoribacter gormanii]
MPTLTTISIYIYCLFFLVSAVIELISFNALSPSGQEIVSCRKKLPFMTDLNSIIKVFLFTFVIIYITPWQMKYKTYLYSNAQELIFIYHVLMIFFLVAFIPIIKYLQSDIRNGRLPKWYLKNILIGDYIHLWGILLACYASIPNF